MANGMRQLAGTRTMYRRADAAPLAGVISGHAQNGFGSTANFNQAHPVKTVRAS